MLLLTDLLNNTWKDHIDYDNIVAALEKIKAVANLMNEKKREAEKSFKVFEIQNSLKGTFPVKFFYYFLLIIFLLFFLTNIIYRIFWNLEELLSVKDHWEL